MRASKTAVIMWKFQSHFATNWKQIRIPPQGNVVKLEAGANEERGEGSGKGWQIYSARGYKRVRGGRRALPGPRPRAPRPPTGSAPPARGPERATPPGRVSPCSAGKQWSGPWNKPEGPGRWTRGLTTWRARQRAGGGRAACGAHGGGPASSCSLSPPLSGICRGGGRGWWRIWARNAHADNWPNGVWRGKAPPLCFKIMLFPLGSRSEQSYLLRFHLQSSCRVWECEPLSSYLRCETI